MKSYRLLALLCAASFPIIALAATPQENAEKTKVTFQVKEMPVADALKRLGALSGITIHYMPPKSGDPKITLEVNDLPAARIFTQIANLGTLKVEYRDDGVHFAAHE